MSYGQFGQMQKRLARFYVEVRIFEQKAHTFKVKFLIYLVEYLKFNQKLFYFDENISFSFFLIEN